MKADEYLLVKFLFCFFFLFFMFICHQLWWIKMYVLYHTTSNIKLKSTSDLTVVMFSWQNIRFVVVLSGTGSINRRQRIYGCLAWRCRHTRSIFNHVARGHCHIIWSWRWQVSRLYGGLLYGWPREAFDVLPPGHAKQTSWTSDHTQTDRQTDVCMYGRIV